MSSPPPMTRHGRWHRRSQGMKPAARPAWPRPYPHWPSARQAKARVPRTGAHRRRRRFQARRWPRRKACRPATRRWSWLIESAMPAPAIAGFRIGRELRQTLLQAGDIRRGTLRRLQPLVEAGKIGFHLVERSGIARRTGRALFQSRQRARQCRQDRRASARRSAPRDRPGAGAGR